MAIEAATYHRIRSAVSAAQKTGAVTILSGSTELSLPAAAEYATNYMALERIHDVRVSVGVGSLEIGPSTLRPRKRHPPSAGAAPTGDRASTGEAAPRRRAAGRLNRRKAPRKYDGTSFVEATIRYVAR